MPTINANGIDICVQIDGPDAAPAVLLLHGLGCQLIQWPDSWVAGIVAAGFRVVRIDNRDVGLSEKLDALGPVDIMSFVMPSTDGRPRIPPYTLEDMCDDAASVMDALRLAQAHVVGVSMGGMIAQRLAFHHPHRVASLTSIMSSSGAAGLPPPDPAAISGVMMPPPMSAGRDAIVAHVERSWNLIGGPHFKSTDVGIGRFTAAAFDRCRHPPGTIRQMAAVIADSGRAEVLQTIKARTLVIHGDIDPLVPLGCGEDTARRIADATLKVMPNMGHDLPESLIPEMLETMVNHWRPAQ